MKFFKIFLVIFLCSPLFAKSDKFSNITLPQSYFLNVHIEKCNNKCMQNLIDKKLIFSFLSVFDSKIADKYIEETYFNYRQALNASPIEKLEKVEKVEKIEQLTIGSGTRFAILVPQKTVGVYAVNSINTAVAYLLTQSNDFEIEVFNSNDEAENSIINALRKIKESGYGYVVAPVTQNGAKIIMDNSDGLQVFIPTLHSSFFPLAPSNIIFGGIDYNAQTQELKQYSNGLATLFSDGSMLSENINDMIRADNKVMFAETFGSANTDFKKFFTRNNISQTSVYYNTPLITTSLLASQIRAYKRKPFAQLSTQINYSPTLLSLTQPADRRNMYIASSIGQINNNFESISAIFGQNLNYDWVSYATAIGVEHISTNFFKSNFKKIFNENVSNSQVNYNINIYKVGYGRFISLNKGTQNANDIDDFKDLEDNEDIDTEQ
jgi:SRSO17 transposase